MERAWNLRGLFQCKGSIKTSLWSFHWEMATVLPEHHQFLLYLSATRHSARCQQQHPTPILQNPPTWGKQQTFIIQQARCYSRNLLRDSAVEAVIDGATMLKPMGSGVISTGWAVGGEGARLGVSETPITLIESLPGMTDISATSPMFRTGEKFWLSGAATELYVGNSLEFRESPA